MGGFHDQHGNYRPDLVADARQAEIDRLRAELASRQIDIDTFLATARQENEEFRSEYGELEVKLENCEAELAVSHGDFAHLQLKAQADSAAKDARIAELEQQAEFHVKILTGGGSAAYLGELAEAKDRIAELEAWGDGLRESLGTTISTMEEERARAEGAEAELKAMREALEPCAAWLRYAYNHVSSVTADKVKAHLPKIDAALDPSPAAKDVCNE